MYYKILVAIDASKNGQLVFEQALDLAKAMAAHLMLLHVLSNEEEGSPSVPTLGMPYSPIFASELAEIRQKQWETYESRGLELLRSYEEKATAAGVMTEYTQNLGSPGRTICEVARTWEADLVVVGRRGLSGINELLLGSVSNYVLHHAPCSVLTVQEAAHRDSEAVHT